MLAISRLQVRNKKWNRCEQSEHIGILKVAAARDLGYNTPPLGYNGVMDMAKTTSKPAKKPALKAKSTTKVVKPKAAALQSRTAAKNKAVKPVRKLVTQAAKKSPSKAVKKPPAKVVKKLSKPTPVKKPTKSVKLSKPKPIAKKPVAAAKKPVLAKKAPVAKKASAKKSVKPAAKPIPNASKPTVSKVAKKAPAKNPVTLAKPAARIIKSKPAAVKSASVKPVPTKPVPARPAIVQAVASAPTAKPIPSKITTNINAVKSAAIKKSAVSTSDNGIKKEGGRYLLSVNTVIELPVGYKPSADEEYMSPLQLAYFRNKLQKWRDDLVEESKQTIDNLREEVRDVGDEAERATRETENSLELRTRDRYRKLIAKIDKAFKRIEDGRYGYCEETDEDIGVDRLDARPIATLCLDAQERWEHRQKQMGD